MKTKEINEGGIKITITGPAQVLLKKRGTLEFINDLVYLMASYEFEKAYVFKDLSGIGILLRPKIA